MILSTTASWSWIGWKLDAQQKLRKKSKGSKIHNRNSFSVVSGESTEPKTPLLFCGTPTRLIPYPQEQLCLPRLSSRKCVVYFHHLGVGFFPTWVVKLVVSNFPTPTKPPNMGFFPMVSRRLCSIGCHCGTHLSWDPASSFTKTNRSVFGKVISKHISTVWGRLWEPRMR